MGIEKQKESVMITSILDNLKGGVIICDFDSKKQTSKVVYINQGWSDTTGYTLEQINEEKNGNPQSLIFLEDKIKADNEYQEQMKTGKQYELMYRIVHRSGSTRWVVDKGTTKDLGNGIFQNLSTITEVTRIKEKEEQMRLLAQIDQLTDLNNKSTFSRRTKNILNRHLGKIHALMMIDIDDFKIINDTYGHIVGDRVLECVAIQLKEFFRSRDVLGRVGGDEFMVLMSDIPNQESAKKKAKELCTAIQNLTIIDSLDISISISIGITYSLDDKPYETLYEEADAALYRAKKSGKNKVSL